VPNDRSHGYDAIADNYIAVRSSIGQDIIQAWASSLPRGADVIDIGAGFGEPVMPILRHAGLNISAIDASSSMVAAFKQRFPDIEITCEAAETSSFFGKPFDATLAIGLMFLLSADVQRRLIHRISGALKSDGRFLFSAPKQDCLWTDSLTGQTSCSLGITAYTQILSDAGFSLMTTHQDGGGNHYYDARKR